MLKHIKFLLFFKPILQRACGKLSNRLDKIGSDKKTIISSPKLYENLFLLRDIILFIC